MRKTVKIIMIFVFVLCLAGCTKAEANQNADSKTEVVINIPQDDTVNGYRIEKKEVPQETALYCANKNSKIFHKRECPSVDKMKQENKIFSNDKNQLLKDGFDPCKSCEP